MLERTTGIEGRDLFVPSAASVHATSVARFMRERIRMMGTYAGAFDPARRLVDGDDNVLLQA